MKLFRNIFFVLIVTISLASHQINASSHHDNESTETGGAGHCTYMVDNPFVGELYMACRTNITAEACMELEAEGDGMMDLSDTKYGEGDCPRETSIGSCERGDWEEVYYEGEGDPVAVEFGCGFAGDWLAP
ncbi:MAG TPA: hypothetical protein EYM72_02455 [Gammaproteobacteria bacterium]|jgi:hypothetical protein|nr:hypothetical protein [Gammaproteobacteria bacterium]